MRILTLHVRREYFDEIAAGRKFHEYRAATPYWNKRVSGQVYDEVHILCGYPPAGDLDRRLRYAWRTPDYDTMIPFWLPGATAPVDCWVIRLHIIDRLDCR
jgi:hypothetical protein